MTLDIMEEVCAKGLYIKSYNTYQMYLAAQKLGSIVIYEKNNNMPNENSPQNAVSWMAHHRYGVLGPVYTKSGHRGQKIMILLLVY